MILISMEKTVQRFAPDMLMAATGGVMPRDSCNVTNIILDLNAPYFAWTKTMEHAMNMGT